MMKSVIDISAADNIASPYIPRLSLFRLARCAQKSELRRGDGMGIGGARQARAPVWGQEAASRLGAR